MTELPTPDRHRCEDPIEHERVSRCKGFRSALILGFDLHQRPIESRSYRGLGRRRLPPAWGVALARTHALANAIADRYGPRRGKARGQAWRRPRRRAAG